MGLISTSCLICKFRKLAFILFKYAKTFSLMWQKDEWSTIRCVDQWHRSWVTALFMLRALYLTLIYTSVHVVCNQRNHHATAYATATLVLYTHLYVHVQVSFSLWSSSSFVFFSRLSWHQNKVVCLLILGDEPFSRQWRLEFALSILYKVKGLEQFVGLFRKHSHC